MAVIEVAMAEASRFGILNTNPDGTIYEFEEKPKEPKSNLASMGIYVFSWNKLRQYLNADEQDPQSQQRFRQKRAPRHAGRRRDGWWPTGSRAIGRMWAPSTACGRPTWTCSIPRCPWTCPTPNWKIYSRNPGLPPHYVAPGAQVENSMISEGGNVDGKVDFSVLFAGVTVEEGAVVRDSIIMPGAVVKKGAKVHYAIVAENAVIGENAVVGARPEELEDTERLGRGGHRRRRHGWARAGWYRPRAMMDTDLPPADSASSMWKGLVIYEKQQCAGPAVFQHARRTAVEI